MPQVFKIGSYWVYFWSNENDPIEPIHVHVSEGAPSANATKIWITKAGKCYLCHNNSKIPSRVLRNIMDIIEARSKEVISKWYDYFGKILRLDRRKAWIIQSKGNARIPIFH